MGLLATVPLAVLENKFGKTPIICGNYAYVAQTTLNLGNLVF